MRSAGCPRDARLCSRQIRGSYRTVEALKVEKFAVFWDSELSVFGVRVYPMGSKFCVVQTGYAAGRGSG